MTEPREIFLDAVALMDAAESSPARRRTAASRFYYSAYHSALLMAVRAGYDVRVKRGGGVHASLRNYMAQSDVPEFAEIAEFLRILYDRRLLADYRLEAHTSFSDIDDSRQLAFLVLDAVDKLASDGI